METTQDSFQFPSVQLQDAVNKLWDKLHEVNGTMNFIMERNIELKKKLDSNVRDVIPSGSNNEDYENKIQGLESEISEYLNHIFELETKLKELDVANSQLSIMTLNYHNLISSYDKIKKYLRLKPDASMPVIIHESDSKKVADLEETIKFLREEVALKNRQITKTTEELLNLNHQLVDLKEKVESFETNQNQSDFLNDKIDEISKSRDVLQEESDNLRLEITRNEQLYKIEHQKLSGEIEILNEQLNILLNQNNEFKATIESLKEENSLRDNRLINESAELMEQIDLLNEQLSNADTLIKSRDKNDETIIKLEERLQSVTNENIALASQIEDIKASYERTQSNYSQSQQRIDELNSQIAILDAELHLKSNPTNQAIEADIEVKQMMIQDFAKNEKELVGKIQQLETELAQKEKLIKNNQEADYILENRLLELESLLTEKDNMINSLQSGSVTKETGKTDNSEFMELERKNVEYKNQIHELETELKHIYKENESKASSIKTLHLQLEKSQAKLNEIENNLLRTDNKISIDEAMRADLIKGIEKQLVRIEMLIGK